MNMPNFNEILKYLRQAAGMSQSELAKKIGVSPSTIGNYEQGTRTPDFEIEEALADIFNVSLDVLRGKTQESYYIDEETRKTAQAIKDNKELSLLFDAAKDAKPEDLKQVHDLLLFLKSQEQKD